MPLKPLLNSDTQTLILGSFPSEISLSKLQYFANPGNDFWKIMSIVVNEDLVNKPYEVKINALLKKKIGLWDVFESCERDESMDDKIVNEKTNDFKTLLSKYPNIKVILVAGQKGYDAFSKLNIPIKFYYIPSTSGANRRLSNEKKAEIIKNLMV